jgi:hypothetical protein
LDLKDLQIKEIIQNCKSLLNEPSIDEDAKKDIDEFNIWKAYSWIEYCILLVRLNKYNLLDQPSHVNEQKKTTTASEKTKVKVDEKIMIQQVRDLILKINYKDEEKMLESLRKIRDLLKIIVKNRKNKDKHKKQECIKKDVFHRI